MEVLDLKKIAEQAIALVRRLERVQDSRALTGLLAG